jgi:hypothetical protein
MIGRGKLRITSELLEGLLKFKKSYSIVGCSYEKDRGVVELNIVSSEIPVIEAAQSKDLDYEEIVDKGENNA